MTLRFVNITTEWQQGMWRSAVNSTDNRQTEDKLYAKQSPTVSPPSGVHASSSK